MDRTYFEEIPRDINWEILYLIPPEDLISNCNKDFYLKNICQTDDFLQIYSNKWFDYIVRQPNGLDIVTKIGYWPMIEKYIIDKKILDLSQILFFLLKNRQWTILSWLLGNISNISNSLSKSIKKELDSIDEAYTYYIPRVSIDFDSKYFADLLKETINVNYPQLLEYLLKEMGFVIRLNPDFSHHLSRALLKTTLLNEPYMVNLILNSGAIQNLPDKGIETVNYVLQFIKLNPQLVVYPAILNLLNDFLKQKNTQKILEVEDDPKYYFEDEKDDDDYFEDEIFPIEENEARFTRQNNHKFFF